MFSHHGGLSSGWSLISVVFHQCNLSSGWSFIRWSLIDVVLHQGGLSLGCSLTKMISHQGSLSTRVSLHCIAHKYQFADCCRGTGVWVAWKSVLQCQRCVAFSCCDCVCRLGAAPVVWGRGPAPGSLQDWYKRVSVAVYTPVIITL